MPSFDIKSVLNLHEVTNGVDQANRIIENSFDFKVVENFERIENKSECSVFATGTKLKTLRGSSSAKRARKNGRTITKMK